MTDLELGTFPEEIPAQETVSLDGMPVLARARTEEHFLPGEPFVYLFDPRWGNAAPQFVAGTIGEISAYDRPFRRNLGPGTLFPVLGTEARLLTGKATVGLDSFEPSVLPDLPRQIMLNTPELRPKMPSAGHVTLETRGTGFRRIIGISMNNNALIPEAAMPLLQADKDFRAVWLLDGPDDPEKQAVLERAILNWSPAETGEVVEEEPAEHEPRRARRHTYMFPGSTYCKVAEIRPSDYSVDNE